MVVLMVYMLVAVMWCSTDRPRGLEVGLTVLEPAVPGEPCLPASGTLQNDLPGLLLDSAGAMLSVKRGVPLAGGRRDLPIVRCSSHARPSPNKPLCQANLSNSIDPEFSIVQVCRGAGRMRPDSGRPSLGGLVDANQPRALGASSMGSVERLWGSSDSGTCTV